MRGRVERVLILFFVFYVVVRQGFIVLFEDLLVIFIRRSVRRTARWSVMFWSIGFVIERGVVQIRVSFFRVLGGVEEEEFYLVFQDVSCRYLDFFWSVIVVGVGLLRIRSQFSSFVDFCFEVCKLKSIVRFRCWSLYGYIIWGISFLVFGV